MLATPIMAAAIVQLMKGREKRRTMGGWIFMAGFLGLECSPVFWENTGGMVSIRRRQSIQKMRIFCFAAIVAAASGFLIVISWRTISFVQCHMLMNDFPRASFDGSRQIQCI
jgi:hypothetical protein